jgi:purine catabolism regulator
MAVTSALTVEDLVRSPALQMRVIAGARGLNRRVAWAHVSELEDPSPWLTGAELIMTTGIGVPREAAAQVAYIDRLDSGGVSALAVSAQLHVPPLTNDMVAAANERGFPIVEVPLSVPFIAIAQEVSAAVQADSLQRLNAQLQVFGAVRWMTADGLSEAEVFNRLERLSGYALYLCTASGRPLLSEVPVPPTEIAAMMPTSPEAPPSIPGGYALPVPSPGGSAGFLVAIERPDANPAGLAAVQHIATVAALQLTMRRQREEQLRREGAETLADLLQGTLVGPAQARRLQRFGFPSHRPLQLLVCRTASSTISDIAIIRALGTAEVPYLLLQSQTEVFLATPSVVTVRSALESISSLRTGASRPFALDGSFEIARREAMWSASRAYDSRSRFVAFGEESSGRWLVDDASSLRALVDHVLGSVLAYDETHDSDLIPTLRQWLDCDRSNSLVASAMLIHTNTVAYRLSRFEVIAERDLNSTSDLTEVWLAMQALKNLGLASRKPFTQQGQRSRA